jgi:hypothetical protein
MPGDADEAHQAFGARSDGGFQRTSRNKSSFPLGAGPWTGRDQFDSRGNRLLNGG